MADSLGTAYVDIEPRADGFGNEAEKQIDKELAGPVKKVNKDVGDGMSGAFKKVGVAIAAAGIGAALGSAVKAAGDLGEQTSKVSVVFGQASGKVMKFGDAATESIGASRLEALEAAGTFGNLLRSVGLSADAAAGMSVEMIQLAGDMASFNNVPVADALAAIRSGLVGETEPLKTFGVNISEAALKSQALKMGLDTSGSSLSANTKLLAAHALIMEQTSLAQGDFARTSESSANQQRIFAAELNNAKAELGEALLPAMKEAIGAGRDLVPVVAGIAGNLASMGAAAGQAIGPLAGVTASFLDSGIGQGVISVGAIALAFQQLAPHVGKAVTAMQGLPAAFAAASSAQLAMGGLAIALGVAAAVYADFQSNAAEAKGRQQDLTAKLVEARSPTQLLAAQYQALADKTKEVAEANKGTAEVIKDVNEASIAQAIADKNLGKIMSELGLSAADLNDALNGNDVMSKRILDSTTALVNEDHKWKGASQGVRDVLREQATAMEDADEAAAQSIRRGAERAITDKLLTRGVYDLAVAEAQGATEAERVIEAGRTLAKETPELAAAFGAQAEALRASAEAAAKAGQATEGLSFQQTVGVAAQGQATEAANKLRDAAVDLAAAQGISYDQAVLQVQADEDTKESTDALADANKALDKTYDDLKKAQDNYIGVAFEGQAAIDNLTEATQTLGEKLAATGDTFSYESGTVEYNSQAARDNRAALRDQVDAMRPVLEGLQKTAGSAEEAAAKTAIFADEQYELSRAAGVSEAAASILRDTILAIPTSHPTSVDIATTGLAEAQAGLDSIDGRVMHARLYVNTAFQGLTVTEIQAIARSGDISGLAAGAIVTRTPDGTLAWVGEGPFDEAVVPLPPGLLEGLQAVAAQARQGRLGAGGGTTVVVNIEGGLGDQAQARHLGQVVGSTAAQVLTERQLATAMRVG